MDFKERMDEYHKFESTSDDIEEYPKKTYDPYDHSHKKNNNSSCDLLAILIIFITIIIVLNFLIWCFQ